MITITDAENYNACNSCQAQNYESENRHKMTNKPIQTIYTITIRGKGAGGISINLCHECANELIEHIKENT